MLKFEKIGFKIFWLIKFLNLVVVNWLLFKVSSLKVYWLFWLM